MRCHHQVDLAQNWPLEQWLRPKAFWEDGTHNISHLHPPLPPKNNDIIMYSFVAKCLYSVHLYPLLYTNINYIFFTLNYLITLSILSHLSSISDLTTLEKKVCRYKLCTRTNTWQTGFSHCWLIVVTFLFPRVREGSGMTWTKEKQMKTIDPWERK